MGKKVFIIAEAGVNHNGDLNRALEMVDCAVDAGVDAIKFQTFISEMIISKNAPKAEYQAANTGGEETQLEMVKKLELAYDEFTTIHNYCNKKGIQFLSTPFDEKSIQFLSSLGMETFKVPSGEITNLPYLRAVSKYAKRVILSTGMADLEEVKDAILVFKENGIHNITVLHCNTEYPTPYEDVNLNAMMTLKEECKLAVGYSDHTLGIEIPVAAVALGAEVIEKHFTLDKTLEGPDHQASLEPEELIKMVQAIRRIEVAMGDGVKKPSKSELKNKNIARRSIVAKKDIEAGEVLSADNLTTKRPGNGISPMRWDDILGSIAKRKFQKDEKIEV